MYKLVLRLPYDITLIRPDSYETIEQAQDAAKTLPNGFEPIDETEVKEGFIPVPLKPEKAAVQVDKIE